MAHHSILQGLPGGPSLDSESLGGRGLAPTLNLEPLAPRGGVGTTRKCGKNVKNRKLSLNELDFSHGSRFKYLKWGACTVRVARYGPWEAGGRNPAWFKTRVQARLGFTVNWQVLKTVQNY